MTTRCAPAGTFTGSMIEFVGKMCRARNVMSAALGERRILVNQDDCLLAVDFDEKWRCLEMLSKDGLIRVPFGTGRAVDFLEMIPFRDETINVSE